MTEKIVTFSFLKDSESFGFNIAGGVSVSPKTSSDNFVLFIDNLTNGWAHRPIEQRQPERRRWWVGVCVCACMHDVFAIYDNNI